MNRQMIKICLAVLLVASLASAKITLRNTVTWNDLEGNDHMNNMLVNTLNSKHIYLLGVSAPLADTHLHFDYNVFEASKTSTKSIRALLTTTLGEEFTIAKSEIDQLHLTNARQLWTTYVSLKPSTAGIEAAAVMLRWDGHNNKFDGHIFKSRNTLQGSIKKTHIIKFTSEFGTEAAEPTLLAEEASEESATAFALAKVVLLSAYENMSHKRGVHPKDPSNEIHYKNYMAKHRRLGVDPITAIVVAAAVVKLAAKLYQVFAKIFATTVKTELIGELKRKGFSEYSMKATCRRFIGVRGNDIDKFLEIFTKIVTYDHPNAEYKRKVLANLNMVKYIDQNTWNMDDFALDTTRGSEDKFATMMYSNENFGDKYHFYALHVDTTFKLSTTLLIYKRTKSVFGGLFGDEQAIIKEVPPTVNADDIEAIRVFNLMMAVKMFSDNLPGEKVAYPQMPA